MAALMIASASARFSEGVRSSRVDSLPFRDHGSTFFSSCVRDDVVDVVVVEA